ncbi:MAG: hypothetical protein J6T94_02755 [Bacteroidaceae bacterium]|nr:hypothetical protein [Bacteroidaceae bacterium]
MSLQKIPSPCLKENDGIGSEGVRFGSHETTSFAHGLACRATPISCGRTTRTEATGCHTSPIQQYAQAHRQTDTHV